MKVKIDVSCYAGYRYPERPLSLSVFGRHYPVQEIIQQCKRQERMKATLTEYFQVKLADDFIAEIVYQPDVDCWYLLHSTVPEQLESQ